VKYTVVYDLAQLNLSTASFCHGHVGQAYAYELAHVFHASLYSSILYSSTFSPQLRLSS